MPTLVVVDWGEGRGGPSWNQHFMTAFFKNINSKIIFLDTEDLKRIKPDIQLITFPNILRMSEVKLRIRSLTVVNNRKIKQLF